jgi:hypoxanthine phosphoribosyltransferase
MYDRSEWQMLNVTWKKYIQLCYQLVNLIPKDHQYERIYAIPRGGLIVGTIISHVLNRPLIESYRLPNAYRTLVVDDLADTGQTLKAFVSFGSDTAVLFYKPQSIVKPTYFVETTERWVKYPYETRETTQR